jgi:fructose-bisphosphate aldolase class II
VPVAIQLDRGVSFESAVRAINLGCNGVMVDASHETFPTNVVRTRRLVEMAHGCGVTVEGKLGHVAGVEGEQAEKPLGDIVYTSVEEARTYVEHTQVDCLAVSIETVLERLPGRPTLDLERLAEINQHLQIPLAFYGGTGLSNEQYRHLIENGVAKINYYNALADTGFAKGVRTAIQAEVERVVHLFGSGSRAEAGARGRTPVEQGRASHRVQHQ